MKQQTKSKISRHMSNIIRIGDVVTSKKTGLPMIGQVIGIWMSGEVYCQMHNTKCDYYSRWSQLYPDWLIQPVLLIKYKEPQRFISKDEYQPMICPYCKQTMKYESLPKVDQAVFPIEDLELIDVY